MIRQRFQWMLAAILTICGATMLTSCKDDEVTDIQADVVIPEGTNLMQLERYSYELPFEIQSDSEWKIEFDFEDDEICYALPDHGTGSQTVKLCVIDNPLENRRGGEMRIVFPKDESKNQVIKLQQKSIAEDDENADDLPLGNRVYVVGYGYNTLGERASTESVSTPPIINFAQAYADGLIVVGPMDASFVAKTYSGSSVSELSNELSADASFKGKYLGFKGEVGASFGTKNFSKQENEYAISYVEADIRSVYMEIDADMAIDYMTTSAYNAINGLPSANGRPSKYTTDEEGLALLVKTYGTHLVTSARLGGCMKYIMTVDISKVEGSYDLKAYANCSYKNMFVKASMNVSNNYKQSYAANDSAITTIVKVQGGSSQAATKLAAADGDNDANFTEWKESLQDVKNQTLVGLDNSNLIPLYDLVDLSQPNGVERYNALRAYINGDKIEEDMSKELDMEYEMGDATHLASIPDFASESNQYTGSLIKDYYRGGQAVARICHEYIPVIDKTQRVRVIYPIVSDKVKYNLGYFAGDATHRPAKVSWSKEGLSVVSLEDQPMGAISELYVRGSNFFDSHNDSIVHALETVDATIQPVKAAAPGDNGSYNYALVKIFDKIWMRENYRAMRKEDGDKFGNNYNLEPLWGGWNGVSCAYYNEEMVTATAGRYHFAPTGWRVPIASDFLDIEATLKANDVPTSSAKAFYSDKDGGILGFDMIYVGIKNRTNPNVAINTGTTLYPVLKDGQWDGFIAFDREQESFGQHWWTWGDDTCVPVRLVQDIY